MFGVVVLYLKNSKPRIGGVMYSCYFPGFVPFSLQVLLGRKKMA